MRLLGGFGRFFLCVVGCCGVVVMYWFLLVSVGGVSEVVWLFSVVG